MANEKKRKASAPPKGFNARKKANKYRPLTEKEKTFYLLYIATKEERNALLNNKNKGDFQK